uniref:Uncharacterized protein n=1 Tax=Arundo donax TaxID=35708 RepID=A0A0A9FYG5_ARUDO
MGLSWQEPVLRHRNLERHHLLPSGEAVAVVGRDLGDAELRARPDELLPDPPSGLLAKLETSSTPNARQNATFRRGTEEGGFTTVLQGGSPQMDFCRVLP